MKVGMRTIKTAVAVMLCIIISRLLKLEYEFYAVIAAIIVMESTISNSLKSGAVRILGTFVGAGVGLACALVSPGNVLLCGLGIIAVIFLCNLMKWNKSISIAGIVFIAIMVNLGGKSPWLYSINRVLDTFIGISVAILVNYLVLPPDHFKKLYTDCRQLAEKVSNAAELDVCSIDEAELEALEARLVNLKNELKAQEKEFKLRKKEALEAESISGTLDACSNIMCHLRTVKNLDNKYGLCRTRLEKQKESNGYRPECQGLAAGEVDAAFNYSLGEILIALQRLKRG